MSLELGSLVVTVAFIALCGGALLIRHVAQTRKINELSGTSKPDPK